MGARIRLDLLGNFACRRDGTALPISSKKGRALLAYLALSAGQTHARERLATLLWADRFDKQARQSLRQCVVTLRKELGDLPETELFIGDRERLGAAADAFETDVQQFRAAAATGTIEGARRATALYRGDLLPDDGTDAEEFGAWLTDEQQRLRQLAEGACERVARHDAQSGDGDRAIAAAERLVQLDPGLESSHRLLIELIARFRGRDAALRQFQFCLEALRREMDTGPSSQTLQLIQEIKQRIPALPRDAAPDDAAPAITPPAAAPWRGRAPLLVALAAVVVVTGGALWAARERPAGPLLTSAPEVAAVPVQNGPAQPKTMPIMVLPFYDYSAPEATQIAEALTDDLTTDLSIMPGMFVIAHATARTYRSHTADPRQIGRETGVRYLLTGGVRLADGELRVNTALVDTQTGAQVWAQHFRGKDGQRLSLEDEIVSSLVASMHLELTILEAMRSARDRPNSQALDDLFLRGRAARMRGPTPENVSEALAIYTQALQLAPDAAWAKIGLAASYVISVTQHQSKTPKDDLEYAERLILESLATNPRCFFCWQVKGMIARGLGRFEESAAAFERSVELNPNNPHAYAWLAATLIYLGRAQESGGHIERAMRLSPRDPLVPLWQTTAGSAELFLGNDARAVEILRQAASNSPRFARLYRVLASALLLTGDRDGAREAMATFRALAANMSPVPPEEAFASDPTYLAQRARVAGAWQRAGL